MAKSKVIRCVFPFDPTFKVDDELERIAWAHSGGRTGAGTGFDDRDIDFEVPADRADSVVAAMQKVLEPLRGSVTADGE